MIVENQIVQVNWSNRNKTYYLNLGYKSFENGKSFDVNINHLPKNSPTMVELICDFCGEHHFNQYRRKSNSKNHFCNRKCQDNFLVGKPAWNAKKVITNCSYCNEEIKRSEWELKRSKNLFCDRECADNFLKEYGEGRPKVERFKINCEQCGKEFERTQKELDRADTHFCTKECSDDFQKGKINYDLRNGHDVNCYNCETEFYLPKYRIETQDRYFCTDECRRIWMHSEEFSILMRMVEKPKVERIKVNCFTCGVEFEKLPCEMRFEKHFCSEECRIPYFLKVNPNPKKDKINVKCYTCGEEKLVHESIFKKNKYFFCSHDCYQQKRMEISDFKGTGTSIHVKINDLLDELGIIYRNEESVGYYSVDIYLPEYSFGIEVMGDYWHSNPNKYGGLSELNEIQLKNIYTDKRKNTFLNKNRNVKILYLWEVDINKRLDVCEELINKFISDDGNLPNYDSFNYSLVESNLILNTELIFPFWKKQVI